MLDDKLFAPNMVAIVVMLGFMMVGAASIGAILILSEIAASVRDGNDLARGRNILLNNLLTVARQGKSMDEWAAEDARRESKRHLAAMVKEFGELESD